MPWLNIRTLPYNCDHPGCVNTVTKQLLKVTRDKNGNIVKKPLGIFCEQHAAAYTAEFIGSQKEGHNSQYSIESAPVSTTGRQERR